jgi:serine/threonine protein phosphatase PrpC
MIEEKTTICVTVLDLCKDGGKLKNNLYFISYHSNIFSVDMEDAHATVLKLDDNRWSHWSYFGIFDGHAGFRTAVKAADKLHLRIVSCLNTLVQENNSAKSPSHVTSSQLDFHKFEMSIKDAYFKFDNEWREENRNNNPGIPNKKELPVSIFSF